MVNRALNQQGSIITMGDVHGCYKTLLALVEKLPKDIPLVFCGDLIDRGPDSNKVIEFVRQNNHYCVKGNHEDMMIRYFEDSRSGMDFIRNGGGKTITSYSGADLNNPVLKADLEWLKGLPTYLKFPNIKNKDGDHLLISHSSAYPVWGKESNFGKNRFDSILMWNRDPRINKIEGIFNIFGHTPQENGPRIKSCYANIDTGAVFSDYKEFGQLTALQFPEMIVYQQENVDFLKG
jgi:serine/threonine protein phosphatase 1